ncbi:MAG: hypothetical protein ACOCZF_03115 [Halorhodospira sp.]
MLLLLVPALTAAGEEGLEIAPPAERDSGCYATPWIADRDRARGLLAGLRERGYVAAVEEGVYERQLGYRLAAPERLPLQQARARIERARAAGFEAGLSLGADGRPTVSYGVFAERAAADEQLRELRRKGFAVTVEPAYRTWRTARVVLMAPVAGVSVVEIGGLWHPVHCDALQW